MSKKFASLESNSRACRLLCGLRSATAILITLVAFPSLGSAGLIVDFSPTADADISGPGKAGGEVAFSDTSVRSPALGGANNYGGSNTTFYGGVAKTGAGIIDQHHIEAPSNLSWNFRLNPDDFPGGLTDTATGLILWQKADFLSGSGDTLNLTSSDSLSVSARRYGSAYGDTGVRFVMQEGSTYYISESQGIIPTGSGSITYTLADPTAANWFAYDPATSIQAVGSAASPSFSNLTSVGAWLDLVSGSTSNRTIRVFGFEANATVTAIPEPSCMVLIAGVMIPLLLRRNRSLMRRTIVAQSL